MLTVRSFWLLVAIYVPVRIAIFLSWPTQINQDGNAYVLASPLQLPGVVLGLGDKPGFLLQFLNIVLPTPSDLVMLPPEGVRVLDEIPTVLWLFLVTSTGAWLFLAYVLERWSASNFLRYSLPAAVLAVSCLMPFTVWDRTNMSESLSISLSVAWLAAWIQYLDAPSQRGQWILFSLALSTCAVRPTNALVVAPMSLALVLLLRSRRQDSGEATSRNWSRVLSVLVCVGLVWVAGVFAVSSYKWRTVYAANRAVSLASLESFQEVMSQRGTPICSHAVVFSEERWSDRNLYSWGAVDAEGQATSTCVGTWFDLGAVSPQVLLLGLSPAIQWEYWSERHEVVLTGGDPFWWPSWTGYEKTGNSSIMVAASERLFSHGFLIWIGALALGILAAITRWPPQFIVSRLRWLGSLALVMAIAAGGTAFVDGGDPARHALPWSALVPVVLFLLFPLGLRRESERGGVRDQAFPDPTGAGTP